MGESIAGSQHRQSSGLSAAYAGGLAGGGRAFVGAAADLLGDYSASLSRAIGALADVPRARRTLAQVTDEAGRLLLANSVRVHQPTCVAHLHCPTLQAGQVGEVLLASANQSLDSWDQSPAASVLEQQLCDFLVQLADLPATGDGVFTAGARKAT